MQLDSPYRQICSDSSRLSPQLVANSVHTADATQLDSGVASAVCSHHRHSNHHLVSSRSASSSPRYICISCPRHTPTLTLWTGTTGRGREESPGEDSSVSGQMPPGQVPPPKVTKYTNNTNTYFVKSYFIFRSHKYYVPPVSQIRSKTIVLVIFVFVYG